VKNKYTNSYLFNRGSSNAVDTLLVVTLCIIHMMKSVTGYVFHNWLWCLYHINLDNFHRMALAWEWGICV